MSWHNPNNIRDLAETSTEILDTIIPEEIISKLSEPNRKYLTILFKNWSEEKDSTDTIVKMKDLLGIKPKKEGTKLEFYLSNKKII